MTRADVARTIRVVETATNALGSSTATSSPTPPVATEGYRTFYISYTRGSDSNRGRSESEAWKLAPGMPGFAGSYSPQAGDHFIFEGGVTWPKSAFPLSAVGSGTAEENDYYGVDPTWFSGASFSQPIFNAESENITGADRNAPGPQDVFIDLRGHDYITIDDIAFENFAASDLTSGYGSCAAVEMVGDQNITINRITVPHMAVDSTSFRGPSCFAVQAQTYAPYSGSSIVENSRFSGATNSYATAILCVGNVENNTVDAMIGEVYPCGHGTISGNLLENCGHPFPVGASGIHADAIQSDNSDGTYYIHDNVIHDTGADSSSSSECEAMLIGNPGETDYVWNNVLYNIRGNAISLTQDAAPGIAAHIWNNSIDGGESSGTYCVRSGHPSRWQTIVIENNFCASSGGAISDPALAATTLMVDHNLLVRPRAVSAHGISPAGAYAYAPTAKSERIVRVGRNLTTSCQGELRQLCDGTVPVSRPGSGSWDVGAYQW